jgi:Rab-GTPase-TBC domain
MFRSPNENGQQMLARVLKRFSLYGSKIGYCQGLGFVVGPLLIDTETVSILVR